MTAPITIRIARLVVEAGSHGEAEATAASFRNELTRLAAEGRLPSQPGKLRPLTALTPSGRGREASGLLAPHPKPGGAS